MKWLSGNGKISGLDLGAILEYQGACNNTVGMNTAVQKVNTRYTQDCWAIDEIVGP
jgi:hypothetical protein